MVRNCRQKGLSMKTSEKKSGDAIESTQLQVIIETPRAVVTRSRAEAILQLFQK
jgi:hypothetical protein